MKRIIISVILCLLLIGCSSSEMEEVEEAVLEEETVEEEVEEGPIMLEKGFLFEYAGREIILADVNPQVTYCRIRIDEETLMISIGKARSVYGITIKVLNASIDPKRVCEVEIE